MGWLGQRLPVPGRRHGRGRVAAHRAGAGRAAGGAAGGAGVPAGNRRRSFAGRGVAVTGWGVLVPGVFGVGAECAGELVLAVRRPDAGLMGELVDGHLPQLRRRRPVHLAAQGPPDERVRQRLRLLHQPPFERRAPRGFGVGRARVADRGVLPAQLHRGPVPQLGRARQSRPDHGDADPRGPHPAPGVAALPGTSI